MEKLNCKRDMTNSETTNLEANVLSTNKYSNKND